jgi:DivIVA domain-containing protein
MAVRLGYDPEQVDDFVRRIERTLGLGPLDGPPVTADEIRNAKFAVKLGGYNETAVDFALDAFIVAVEARAGQNTASAPLTPAMPPPSAARKPAKNAVVENAVVKEPAVEEPAVKTPAAEEPAPAAPKPASPAVAASSPRTRAEERARSDTALATTAGSGESWLEAQAARVERVAFRPGRLGMGYREEEVDAFLDRVVATLRGTAAEPLTAEQVRKATFATVVFRPGYAIHEVDGFLAEMANVLERCP